MWATNLGELQRFNLYKLLSVTFKNIILYVISYWYFYVIIKLLWLSLQYDYKSAVFIFNAIYYVHVYVRGLPIHQSSNTGGQICELVIIRSWRIFTVKTTSFIDTFVQVIIIRDTSHRRMCSKWYAAIFSGGYDVLKSKICLVQLPHLFVKTVMTNNILNELVYPII